MRPRAITGWSGAFAALLSGIVMARCGRVETGSPYAPFNAVSHVVHGRDALYRNAPTLHYTGLGAALHLASAAWWGWVYELLMRRQPQPARPVHIAAGAAAVTAVAAVVDLKLVPERLTPGFERRLSPSALVGTYVALALGLALGGYVAAQWRDAGR